MEPDDPPILSPDGRYAFAHGEIERRNNEWLTFAYLADTRRDTRLFQLGTGHCASIEWTGQATFVLTVGHEGDPDCFVSVNGDADERRFELGDGSRRGPLKDLERILDQWFETHRSLPSRTPSGQSTLSPADVYRPFVSAYEKRALAAILLIAAAAFLLPRWLA